MASMFDKVGFGKHRDMTWHDVRLYDYSYAEWCADNCPERVPEFLLDEIAEKRNENSNNNKEEKDMSDNKMENRVVFLDSSVTTIKVAFKPHMEDEINNIEGEHISEDDKGYTYKATKALAQTLNVGDFVVVPVRGDVKAAIVTHIDEESDIMPDSGMEYKWIIGKCDLTYYREVRQKEAENVKNLKDAMREQMRERYRQEYAVANTEIKQIGRESIYRSGSLKSCVDASLHDLYNAQKDTDPTETVEV